MAGLTKGVETCPQCEADLRSYNLLNLLITNQEESSDKEELKNPKAVKTRKIYVYAAFFILVVMISYLGIHQHFKIKNKDEMMIALHREKDLLNQQLTSQETKNKDLKQELEAERIQKEKLQWVTVKIKSGDTFNELIKGIQSEMPFEERKKLIIEKNGILDTDFIIKGESIEIIK
ncbi:hypothetical protein [Saccharicrinis sp. 156]|uniref:hypothetical protein n=1 Tax=Saccharicrinis sp. 156 TaxID=3417574 RepID=UPI003D32BAF9